MEELYREMLDGLRSELEVLEQGELSGLKKMVEALGVVRRVLKELRELALREGFDSVEAEVRFFKVWKPAFHSWQVYYVELGTIEEQLPVGDEELRTVYLKEQLGFIGRFFKQQAFLFQYYRLGAVELDRLYFVRGSEWPGMLPGELPDLDPGFSTQGDYLFAKFMAYERLRERLLEMMTVETGAEGSFVSKKGRPLKWTGDTCNLIEVAYGIYDTLQINEGEVDLSDIIDWLEGSLQVNLSRYYRRFMEIKRRKAMSKTRYLDAMRDAVNKRIDDTDAFQADKRRSFRNH